MSTEADAEDLMLNEGFWGPYRDIPSMATATKKEEIIQIVENFALINRRHIRLFQRLKATVLRTIETWAASDLALLCRAWSELGFLHEDLCIAMAPRVAATLPGCTVSELVCLLDAYATARCYVPSAVDVILQQTVLRLEEFNASQLCHHACSLARLNVHNEPLVLSIANKLGEVEVPLGSFDVRRPPFSAREISMAAYSFAKLGCHSSATFQTLSRAARPVIRDFSAKELQTLIVAVARARHTDHELLDAISIQAQRRVAQFSAEALTLMLRGLAFFGRSTDPLFTRVLAELPRAILTFRPGDVAALLNAFAAAQVRSPFLFDLVTPFILEKAPMFTAIDWSLALRSYAAFQHADAMFLACLAMHFKASDLSPAQRRQADADLGALVPKAPGKGG